jgi:hypothetical protein
MPTVPTVSNPVFSDEPPASCTYSVTAPSLAFTGAGGSKTITVNTQAGCNFTPSLAITNDTQGFAITTVGNVITLTVSPNTFPQYGKIGVLRIHTGLEVFDYAIAQAASPGTTVTALTAINFPAVSAGDIPVTSTVLTIVNNTGVAQRIHNPLTSGPFAVSANNCGSTMAIGASCVINVQFVPNKDGAMSGELMLAGTSTVWRAGLNGTALPTRFNVAAARKGASVTASDRLQVVDFSELTVINGDRRGKQVPNQGFWYVRASDVTAIQPIEIKFSSPQPVEWLYLFGRPKDGNYSDPATTTIADGNVAGNDGFTVEYWTGTSWLAVSELLRVGSPNLWQRVKFTPVTTDRIRLKLTPPYTTQVIVSEIEVWTVVSDVTPAAFTFANVTDVAPSTMVKSAAITPSGYNAATRISISGGSYSIGCGAVFTVAVGTISPGQSVCVQHASNPTSAGTTLTTLTIGGVSGAFISTTRTTVVPPADVTPDSIPAQSRSNVAPAIEINFDAVRVTGISTSAVVSITNGEYSIGCTSSFTSLSSSISNGENICVRHLSSPSLGQTVTSVITIGSLNVGFSSSTAAQLVSPGRLARRDFNHDGKSDFVWRDLSTGNTVVSLMNGLIPAPTSLGVIGLNAVIQGIGDFDGDGKDDILWRNITTGEAIISFMDGATVLTWETVGLISLNLTPQSVGDFNGDGLDDVVWRNGTTGNVIVSYMNGAMPLWSSEGLVGLNERIQGVGDFDGDGKTDMLWRNVNSGNLAISYMTGSTINMLVHLINIVPAMPNPLVKNGNGGRPILANFGTIASNLVVQGVGDFNGNSKDDILWRNSSTGEVFISFIDGVVQTWASVGVVASNLEIQGIGDYNGDGKDDILWRNTATGSVSISFMNGAVSSWGNVGAVGLGAVIYGK